MAKVSSELDALLTQLITEELGSKTTEGITYILALKDKDSKLIQNCMAARKEAEKCGINPDDIIRTYKVGDGAIFDINLPIVADVSGKWGNAMNVEVDLKKAIIGMATKRRNEDIKALATKCERAAKSGKKGIEVALYSRNIVPKIVIGAKDKNGNAITCEYDAYALRHWDITNVNEKYLFDKGLKISKIMPCEILPSKTGVRFMLQIAKM